MSSLEPNPLNLSDWWSIDQKLDFDPIDTVHTMNNVRTVLYNDHIDVAGNILKVSLVSQWNEIKSDFVWYDSHIILRPLWMHEYRFDVLEKDWSFSNMCGNGAVAAQIFLDKSPLKFITKTWDRVHVIRKDSSIEVQFPKISNQTLSNSSQIISQIQEMSQGEIVSKLWIQDGSNTSVYLRSLLVNSIWSWIWANFLSTLSLKDIYFSAWEPHLLLEIAWDLSPKNRDACLKILTPLLRFFLKEMGMYHEDVNVMAYIWNEHDDHIKLFPSERWVSHEYNQDQTGACGTWCVALASYLHELTGNTTFQIQNRSGYTHSVTIQDGTPTLIVDKQSVMSWSSILQHTQESLPARAMCDWYTLNNPLSSWEFQQDRIDAMIAWPESGRKIASIFWNTLISSCCHETEHGDIYKASSIQNILHILKLWNIDTLENPYWDTTRWDTKGFPNIKVPKSLSSTEDKLFKYIETLMEQDISLKDSYKFSNELFQKTLWEYDDVNSKKDALAKKANSEFGKWCNEIAIKLGIDAFVQIRIPNDAKRKQFYIFLLQDRLSENLSNLFVSFRRNIFLDKAFMKASGKKRNSLIHKNFENALLSHFVQMVFSEKDKTQMQNIWFLDENWSIDLQISSEDRTLQWKFAQSLQSTLDDPDIGSSFWKDIFEEVSGGKVWKTITLANLVHNERSSNVTAVRWENDWNIAIGNDILSFYDGMQFLASSWMHENFQGIITCVLLILGWIPHVGTERGIRESVVKVLKENSKTDTKYLRFIQAMKLSDDYIPKKTSNDYLHFPAWSDTQWNMLELIALWPELASEYYTQVKNNMLLEPTINRNKFLQNILLEKWIPPIDSLNIQDLIDPITLLFFKYQ